MERLQIYLEPELNRKLERLSYELRTSKASLVRDGVRLLLREKGSSKEDPLMGLKRLAGSSGRADISKRHDFYLTESKKSRAR